MMKTKKILALVSALVLILTAAFPAHAAEGAEPVLPEQEEVIPPEALPGGDISDAEIPGGEIPDADAPGEEIPGEELPGEDIPDGEIPDGENPGEDVRGEELPEEETPDGEIPGEPEPAVIDVQVPASGRVVINPYRMAVASSYGETTDQIVHEPQVLTSSSDFPVQVSARAVGRLSYESEARFVAFPPAPDAADKQIFMYVEFQPADFLWSYAYSDAPNQLLVTDWGVEKENVLTLAPFGMGYFRLFGAMTDYPDTMWGEIDAPNVTLAFTFAPLEAVMDTEELLPPEEPAEEPIEGLEEEPAEGPVEGPEEEPAEDPAEEPIEEPVEGPIEGPGEEPAEVPAEEPVEEEPVEAPVEEPVQEPTEESNGW